MSASPKVLWGLRPLLGIISNNLVNELRMCGFPDLSDGGITYGKPSLNARKAPPSVVAMWAPSGATGVYWGKEIPAPDGSGRPAQPVLNSLATERCRIDFHCWAAVNPPDPFAIGDTDACRLLVHQLWRVIHHGCEGSYEVVSVTPVDDPPSSLGAQAVLRVEFGVPVVDNLITYVPPGTKGSVTVQDDAGDIAAQFFTPGST